MNRGRPKLRRALVTGASAGIGEAFAREFASHGFNLVLVARRNAALEALAGALVAEFGVNVHVHACDLLDPDAAQGLFDECAQLDLDVDVLVNNAGLMHRGSFVEQDIDSINAITGLNIVTLTFLTRLFLEPMLERGYGRVLNITSTTAFQAGPTIAVYAASKTYILGLTEALAEELRGTGVCATAFCPGFTDTHMAVESFGENIRGDAAHSWMMMAPGEVAREGFRACMSGRVISVPGVANNILTAISRVQPRWFNRRLQSLLYDRFFES